MSSGNTLELTGIKENFHDPHFGDLLDACFDRQHSFATVAFSKQRAVHPGG